MPTGSYQVAIGFMGYNSMQPFKKFNDIRMKTRTLAFLLFFIPAGTMAQSTLSFSNNALRADDKNEYREIQFADPGSAGANQVWNFPDIRFTGNDPVSAINSPSIPKMNGVKDYNLLLTDNGYDYFMNLTATGLEEMGYWNAGLKLLLRYSDPVLRMRYPFSFGDNFTDRFDGTAWYGDAGTGAIQLSGESFVSADGHGKLVLRDQEIRDVLRVKTVKKGLQINTCGTTDVNIVKYSWYASGYRYPVMNVNIVETSSNGGTPVITKTAYINTTQDVTKKGNISITGSVPAQPNAAAKADIKVMVSPNPFKENLTYSYVLPVAQAVTIDLYDLSGKYSGCVVASQQQSAGYQNGTFSAATFGLPPGVYFIRFTFEEQVVISKVVKQ